MAARRQVHPSFTHAPGQTAPKGRGHSETLKPPSIAPERLSDHTLESSLSLQETRDCRQAGLPSHGATRARDSGMGPEDRAGSVLTPRAGERAPLGFRPGHFRTLTESPYRGFPSLAWESCASSSVGAETGLPGPVRRPRDSTAGTAALPTSASHTPALPLLPLIHCLRRRLITVTR